MAEDVMVDLETLGREPGTAIVAIGAVSFDMGRGVTDEFEASVSLTDCQRQGLSIDAETLEWWLDQSDVARSQLQGGDELNSALRDFEMFVREHNIENVWANSPAFDCAILRRAYEIVGREVPWAYWEERDYRTIREVLGTWPTEGQDGTAHNALDDARYQAKCLLEGIRRLEYGDD